MDHEPSRVADFERSVFINCPFDPEYFPLLKTMLWVLVHVGLKPRLSLERSNAGEGRLRKIRELIEASKYGIHDLSRLKASKKNELYRLNMPFELGIDYGCKLYSPKPGHADKVLLVLEAEPFSAKKALSDIAFADPQYHKNDEQQLVKRLREWLVTNEFTIDESESGLWYGYNTFYSKLQINLAKKNWSVEEVNNMPMKEFIKHLEVAHR